MRTVTALLCIVLLGGLALAQSPSTPGQSQALAVPMQEPTLTLSQLENRLTELQKGLEGAQANVIAFQAVIAETQNWIKKLEDSALPKKPDKPIPPKQ